MIIVCPTCLAKNRVPEEKLSANPSCGQCHAALLPAVPIELNEQNFSQFISHSDLPVFIDLWAEWCGPCKMMQPILEDTSRKLGEKVKIIKVDVDKNPLAASKFQVRGVPTLILFHKGKTVWRQSGVVPAHQLAQIIESNLMTTA